MSHNLAYTEFFKDLIHKTLEQTHAFHTKAFLQNIDDIIVVVFLMLNIEIGFDNCL